MECPEQFCWTCGNRGHHERICHHGVVEDQASLRPCRRCQSAGHTTVNCPDQLCKFCGERGHHDWVCQQRVIDDETSFVPVTMPVMSLERIWPKAATDSSVPVPKPSGWRFMLAEANSMVDPSTRAKGPRWRRHRA